MYEVELRALVNDFEGMKARLASLAKPSRLDEREVTVFFSNPQNDAFDLRLRLRKHKYLLNFKEGLAKTARKEIESGISDPHAIYELLLLTGFKIRMIIARVKNTYVLGKFEILLNSIIDWGDAIEVETMINDQRLAEPTRSEIEKFMHDNLGITQLLSKDDLTAMNNRYGARIDFTKIPFDSLLDYVNGTKESLKFM